METMLSIFVGIGLAAACGFRVFIPLLVVSVAALSGHLTLAPSFQWMGTWPALIAFGVATVLEIGAYYIPWLDHLLDTIATPAAVVAGTIISASVFTNMSPFLQWTLAVVAGGSAAGLVQSGTVLTRAASLATTGGLGNPLVSTGEWVLSILTSLLAIIVPVVTVVVLAGLGIFLGWKLWRRWKPARA
jgi:hypothetical protein